MSTGVTHFINFNGITIVKFPGPALVQGLEESAGQGGRKGYGMGKLGVEGQGWEGLGAGEERQPWAEGPA